MCRAPVGEGANRTRIWTQHATRRGRPDSMLIGAHVSPAGGPANAVERGVERGCGAIQFFNQSPRAWRPRVYSDDEVAAFHEAMDAVARSRRVLIHAVYLLNCASEDAEIRGKSLTALIAALQAGDALGAHGVVLHPGSALKGGPVDAAHRRARRRRSPRRWRSPRTARCTSRTPPAPAARSGARSRSSRALIEQAGGGKRLGVCLDSCHLLASGYDVRTAEGLGERDRRLRLRSSASTASRRCTSTTRRPRWAPTSTATRRRARATSAARAARRSCPSRASMGCR